MSNSESRKLAASIRLQQIAGKEPGSAMSGEFPRFVADVMLGRLAKWLRLAGFDVLYSNKYTDDELVRISNAEARVLLSRDTHLLVRKAVLSFVFIRSQDLASQIRQVFTALKISGMPPPLTRCLVCNEPLKDTERESVRDLVPEFVYRTQDRFKRCAACRKIFWAGTHRKSMILTLETLLQ